MERRTRQVRRLYFAAALTAAACMVLSVPAFAADEDPPRHRQQSQRLYLQLHQGHRRNGLGWGIVQLGMSVQSHDASQRTQGILCVFGGLLIAFSKEILGAIGVV